jgi:predicted nucleotidyltransferase
VFGSVARNSATPTSDLDLLVDPIPGRTFRKVDLAIRLGRVLGRRVDVVAERELFWLVQPQAVAEAIPL